MKPCAPVAKLSQADSARPLPLCFLLSPRRISFSKHYRALLYRPTAQPINQLQPRHLPLSPFKKPSATQTPSSMAPTSLTKDLKRKRGEGEATEATRPPYKQRVLVLSSRGISQRQRHLMTDLTSLLPHAKKGEPLTELPEKLH